MVRNVLVLLFLFILILVIGCSMDSNDEMHLRIGLMPAVDAAPILVAADKGYFNQLGLNVDLDIFNNAQNRQSALQTNSIDGTITDLIALAVNVDAGFKIRATTMTNGVFPILMKEGSMDRETVKVGIMEVSVTNFLTDQWLGDRFRLEKIYINDIPTRLNAIINGDLDMGSFPEPFASIGVLEGLEREVYEFGDYCPDVLVFTEESLAKKEEAIGLFHTAYNMAVEDIHGDRGIVLDVMIASIPNLDSSLRDIIELPEYSMAGLQDEEYIERIIKWTSAAINRELNVTPNDLVEGKFVND